MSPTKWQRRVRQRAVGHLNCRDVSNHVAKEGTGDEKMCIIDLNRTIKNRGFIQDSDRTGILKWDSKALWLILQV